MQRELWVSLVIADDVGCDVSVVDADAGRVGGMDCTVENMKRRLNREGTKN